MRNLRNALTISLAGAAMLIGAQAALADDGEVPTSGKSPNGHAVFFNDGLVATIEACDDDKDGSGVVGFILDRQPEGATGNPFFTNLVGAVNRNGDGTCGEEQQVQITDADDLWVKVCLHDKSEVKKPAQSPFDPNLRQCNTENVAG